MHPSLPHTRHRPWPLPEGRWTWRRSWCDLLFAHWPVPRAELQPLVPEGLQVQEFDGTSWVGVVPFRMSGVMRRPFPDLPGVSAFPELNLRLYVEAGGKPGVWFLSLDATNPLAVWAARKFFHLPYFKARISIAESGGTFHYQSSRSSAEAAIGFRADYTPSPEVYHSQPGALEHWLTERYCLYARSPQGQLFRTEVHHEPWPLQRADVRIHENQLGQAFGLALDGDPALVHFSRRIDVVVWDPQPLHERGAVTPA